MCGDLLEGIFYRQCTCKLCGNGAHYGYNCPLKVLILPNPEPFNNQTIKELLPTVPSFDSKFDLLYDYPNIFDPPPQLPLISYKFCGNDARYGHYCTPQVSFVYPEPCYNQDVNFSPEFQEFHDFQQHLCCENGRSIYSKKEEEKQIKEDQAANARYWKIPACYDDFDDDYAFAITLNKPDYSLSMGDEHPDTGPAMESDKFIKSSVENLVPILSESEGESEYVPEKIFLNPMFDEEIIPMKIDQHPHNAEYDLIESLRIHDSSLIILSKIDSLLDEFADELALLKSIPPGIDETDCDFEEEIRLIKKFFDSLMEEIDLSFTPYYPMSPCIEDDGYDSERNARLMELCTLWTIVVLMGVS
nr:hypothetical protein [Tanacetum cinerariifolium]